MESHGSQFTDRDGGVEEMFQEIQDKRIQTDIIVDKISFLPLTNIQRFCDDGYFALLSGVSLSEEENIKA